MAVTRRPTAGAAQTLWAITADSPTTAARVGQWPLRLETCAVTCRRACVWLVEGAAVRQMAVAVCRRGLTLAGRSLAAVLLVVQLVS